MENNNSIRNTESNANESNQTQTDVPQQPESESPKQPSVKHSPQQNNKKWLIPGLIGAVMLSLSIAGYFAYQNFQMVNQKASQIQPTIPPSQSSPTTTIPSVEPITKPPIAHANTFNYNNFTIGYPDSWTLMDISIDENFPLRDRLAPFYTSQKAIALSKDGIYLIITIEEGSEGESGGMIFDQTHYNEFISDKDTLLINELTYFINKNHYNTQELSESHGGPYTWSAVVEYREADNNRGYYDSLIKKDEYSYNFIITGIEGGQTNPALQDEVLQILQSITW